MDSFVYNANPGRVVFGSGSRETLSEEAARLGLSRLFVVGPAKGHDRSEEAAALLGNLVVGRLPGAQMHTPVEVTERALNVLRDLEPDGIVSVGGGSTIGLGKALAIRTQLPQIAIPTTFAGSEMTPILGETKDGLKTTRKDPSVLPKLVIYDPDLSMTMPTRLAATSGLNAMAHAVEALYALERNPVISLMAFEAIEVLFDALPRIINEPEDRAAREKAVYGAWLCGVCLGSVGMALHHKLCHTLGGTFDLPHAETHSVVLPHALAYNLAVLPDLAEGLRDRLAVEDPARAIYDLGRRLGVPQDLGELGLTHEDVGKAVNVALSNPYWNPRELEREPLRILLQRAQAGAPPESVCR